MPNPRILEWSPEYRLPSSAPLRERLAQRRAAADVASPHANRVRNETGVLRSLWRSRNDGRDAMSQLDVINAKSALAARLRIWGIDEPAERAGGFIDDLVSQGWAMSPKHEARPRPPRRSEECPMHAGQHHDKCGGCATDRLAVDANEPLSTIPGATPVAIREQIRGRAS